MLDLERLLSDDDEAMQRINSSYGSSGSSMANPIHGFSPGRIPQSDSTIGRVISQVGSSIRELFKQPDTPIAEYTRALKEMIKSTFYIEEWLKIVLDLKQEKRRD